MSENESSIHFIQSSDQWLSGEGPLNHAVVSSRARYARNIEHVPFAPRARGEQLREVLDRIDHALRSSRYFTEFKRIVISDINSLHRLLLKESHLLSAELEQGGEHRVVYISPDYRISIMINEEDHLRIQALDVGFQLRKVLAIVDEVENRLSQIQPFAWSERFGYLTACPTNIGTGMRLSVMFHLPGLVLIGKIDEIVQSVSQYGLTARGIYGEHSEHHGDFFQISNEVTLGKQPDEILSILESVTEQIVEREMAARDALFRQKPVIVKDMISRALATLQNAHIMDSSEALSHLSKIRLGIDRGFFHPMSHTDLSRLMVEIQPAHLQCFQGGQLPVDQRDSLRAQILHKRLDKISYN